MKICGKTGLLLSSAIIEEQFSLGNQVKADKSKMKSS